MNAAERPRAQNDALNRLQLTPSDPRWTMQPPFKWVEVQPGAILPGALSGTRCWFCAESVNLNEPFLYSKRLTMLAHHACRGDSK